MQVFWNFLSERGAWSLLIVVSAPSRSVLACIVDAHEPVGIRAFSPELAIKALDEVIVSV